MLRNRLRWLPAIAVPALIAAGVVAANASDSVELPERTPAEVFVMLAEHSDAAVSGSSFSGASFSGISFSGTVEQDSELGLPELPSSGPDAAPEASEALEWLSGSHSVRVFADGPDKARIQVLDQLAERDVIVNGTEVWVYDSRDKTAEHLVIPADAECVQDKTGGMRFTPGWLAEQLLAKIDASTEVTLGSNLNVAGRAAYDLLLTPRTTDTLVGSVSIAVDGETGMPLSVRVLARGQDEPAISVAFTELSLETPVASLFEFTPPKGTDVTEHPAPDRSSTDATPPESPESIDADRPDPIFSGSDWTTVVEFPAASAPADLFDSPLFAQLTTAVDGGRVIGTSLLNVLVTDDGRVAAGAVPVRVLQEAVTGK
jgi:outer membrane lipoprotein-sorting protein